jgi:hypothetical protein
MTDTNQSTETKTVELNIEQYQKEIEEYKKQIEELKKKNHELGQLAINMDGKIRVRDGEIAIMNAKVAMATEELNKFLQQWKDGKLMNKNQADELLKIVEEAKVKWRQEFNKAIAEKDKEIAELKRTQKCCIVL